MLALWIEFILCATAIVAAGTYLSIYGDIIAEKVGLGRAWIGLILMASVTSLPELINGVSSVAYVGAPDLALGDVMGSCIFNMAIIILLDLLHGPEPIFSRADQGHILSAGFGIILIGVAAVSILAGPLIPAFGSVAIYTPLIIFIYFVAIRGVFQFEKRKIARFVGDVTEGPKYEDVTAREAVIKYSISAVVIVVAATFLPVFGERIAVQTGLGESFVGTVLIGITTSLPELIVSIAAFRIGAADMAIANLFGSNMFNILVVAVDDIFYTKGPVLLDVSQTHTVTAFMAVIMTAIAIVSLTFRIKKKAIFRIGWDAAALAIAFVVSILLLYYLSASG
jgi:cation:H+ antiporter